MGSVVNPSAVQYWLYFSSKPRVIKGTLCLSFSFLGQKEQAWEIFKDKKEDHQSVNALLKSLFVEQVQLYIKRVNQTLRVRVRRM